MNCGTEDEVRDSAELIFGFGKTVLKGKQGTGRIASFENMVCKVLFQCCFCPHSAAQHMVHTTNGIRIQINRPQPFGLRAVCLYSIPV